MNNTRIARVKFKLVGGDDDGRVKVIQVDEQFEQNIWAFKSDLDESEPDDIVMTFFNDENEAIGYSDVDARGFTDGFVEKQILDKVRDSQ